MISIIIPVNHPIRVNNVNKLYKLLKTEAGVPVEVIVACDNPEIFDLLEYDKLVKIPRRIGFTQAVNLAEKYSTYDIVWFMDDSVTPTKNWAKIAIDAFYQKFPDGLGIMEISGVPDCAVRCITTKQYTHPLTQGHMLWPEYIHCGDSEHYEVSLKQGKFYAYPEKLLIETKINDASRLRNTKVFKFDDKIREERRNNGFPLTNTDQWSKKLQSYCASDPDLTELCENILQTTEEEVEVCVK